MCACLFVRVHAFVSACKFVSEHTWVCMSLCFRKFVYVRVCVCVNLRGGVWESGRAWVFVCLDVVISVCVCVRMCRYEFVSVCVCESEHTWVCMSLDVRVCMRRCICAYACAIKRKTKRGQRQRYVCLSVYKTGRKVMSVIQGWRKRERDNAWEREEQR